MALGLYIFVCDVVSIYINETNSKHQNAEQKTRKRERNEGMVIALTFLVVRVKSHHHHHVHLIPLSI